MFSSINGHWGSEWGETKRKEWVIHVPEVWIPKKTQENKSSNWLQAYIHINELDGCHINTRKQFPSDSRWNNTPVRLSEQRKCRLALPKTKQYRVTPMAHRSRAWESQIRRITWEGWTHPFNAAGAKLCTQTVHVSVADLFLSISLMLIYVARYGALWNVTWLSSLNQTQPNQTERLVQALGRRGPRYLKASYMAAIRIFYSGPALMPKQGPFFTKTIVHALRSCSLRNKLEMWTTSRFIKGIWRRCFRCVTMFSAQLIDWYQTGRLLDFLWMI